MVVNDIAIHNFFICSPTHRSEVTEVVYDIPKQNTSRQSSDSAETAQCTTNHEGSSEQVIPNTEPGYSPPIPANVGSSDLVYAQVDVKQNQVPPPSNDDTVQYTQLKIP